MYHENMTRAEKEKPTGLASLSFQHTTAYRISRLLVWFNIKMVHILFKKTACMVRLAKDNTGRKGLQHTM
jgi:hypothetical protein